MGMYFKSEKMFQIESDSSDALTYKHVILCPFGLLRGLH